MEYDEMTPSQKMRQNRAYLSLVVAFSHFALMALGMVHRLSFSIATEYELLQSTLNSPLWTVLHGLCFVAIVVSLWRSKWQVSAMAAATGVMSAWAFLNLLWGLTTPTPVSLSGPILGGGVATLAYLLAASLARYPRLPERGE